MGREANIHSIKALEKQIKEDKGDIIELKRARNLLLNISTRVPPEILGNIFTWSLAREASRSQSHFDGLRKGSYNFLLVCHHWFEVASRTPELWSFWGNTLQDWKKRYHRSGAAPLDLVLDEDKCDPDVLFDKSLQGAIRGHVARGTVRQVHLSLCGDTLTSIISSLTPDDEGARNENIESIVWQNLGALVDASDFFGRSCFSKLCRLDLIGDFRISSWDSLATRTTLLTTLSLGISSPPPTASQLFSILTSNPNLQQLTLSDLIPPDSANGSVLQVPLRNLKLLSLRGEFRHLFGLLRRLALPETLNTVDLVGLDATVEEISQILEPYMRDYFRRDVRFQDRLEVSSISCDESVSVSVRVPCTQDTVPTQKPFVAYTVVLADPPPPDVMERLSVDLITLVPQEYVVSLSASLDIDPPEELFSTAPNIEFLCLDNVDLSEGFLQPNPDGPRANTKLLPHFDHCAWKILASTTTIGAI